LWSVTVKKDKFAERAVAMICGSDPLPHEAFV
jgi:hypothetical protein